MSSNWDMDTYRTVSVQDVDNPKFMRGQDLDHGPPSPATIGQRILKF